MNLLKNCLPIILVENLIFKFIQFQLFANMYIDNWDKNTFKNNKKEKNILPILYFIINKDMGR